MNIFCLHLSNKPDTLLLACNHVTAKECAKKFFDNVTKYILYTNKLHVKQVPLSRIVNFVKPVDFLLQTEYAKSWLSQNKLCL